MKIQEEILDMKSKSDRKLEDKEDLTLVRHPMAKKINRIMFETEIPKKVKTIWGSFFSINLMTSCLSTIKACIKYKIRRADFFGMNEHL